MLETQFVDSNYIFSILCFNSYWKRFVMFVIFGCCSKDTTNFLISTHAVWMIGQNYIYDTHQLEYLYKRQYRHLNGKCVITILFAEREWAFMVMCAISHRAQKGKIFTFMFIFMVSVHRSHRIIIYFITGIYNKEIKET